MKLKIVKFLDLAVEYSIYFLIFYIPISIAAVSTFVIIALVLFLIKKILLPDFISLKSNKLFFILFILFFIFLALSLINSGPLLAKSIKALFLKWGRFVLIIWMLTDTFRDSKRIVKGVSVFLFSAIMVGISALSQKFFGLEFLRHRQFAMGGITGPFGNRNDLASYLICIIPLALSFSLSSWKRISVKIGFCLISIILIACLVLIHCRGSWIGLTAGLIFLTIFLNKKSIPSKILWFILIMGYCVCMPLMAIALYSLKNNDMRVELYHGAWKMITEHPFLGKGLGTFMDYSALPAYNLIACYAHNCYLQIWAEAGIFSLLSFLVLNGYVLLKSIRVLFKMPVSLNFFILIGLTSGYLGILVHCFFDTQLYSFQLSFVFWIILGLTVASSNNEGKRCLSNLQE